MTDRKISELTNITGANLADADEFVVVDTSASETKAITRAELGLGIDKLGYSGTQKLATTSTGIAVTGDATFADNGKAIFGAGSDLQIYHDGSDSYIDEVGAGVLKVRSNGTGIDFESTGGETLAQFVTNGAVTLYYNNAAKIATTSTGVDVTGTITSDGLTVDGSVGIGTSSPDSGYKLDVAGNVVFGDGGGFDMNVDGTRWQFSLAGSEKMRIASDGSVGIGTSSPSAAIDVRGEAVIGSGTDGLKLSYSAGNSTGIIDTGFTSTGLEFRTGNSFAAIIDSSGRVGIGTNSPGRTLDVNGIIRSDGTSSGFALGGNTSTPSEGAAIHRPATSTLAFVTDSSERMRIDSSGNVGIGTSSPAAVTGFTSSRVVAQIDNSGYGQLRLGGSVGTMLDHNNGGTTVTTLRNLYGATNAAAELSLDSGTITFNTGTSYSEAMRIDSSGNVGIGTDSGTTLNKKLTTLDDVSIITQVSSPNNTDGGALFLGATGLTGNATQARIKVHRGANQDTGAMSFATANGTVMAEAMRIDSDGNLLVGTTDSTPYNNTTGEGIALKGDNIQVARQAATALFLNRMGTDGEIAEFLKDGAPVGSIGNSGNYMYLASQGPSAQGVKITDNFIPATTSGANNDNAMDLGGASVRWDDVYATNGTIQTSDANEKQDIDVLSDAEQRVAVAAKGLLRKFRWKDAVAEKGDDARIHFGIIAQDLQAAFEAEGLDAGDYAMFIHSTWTDEETGEEKSRMGVRYSELLAFIIAAI